MKNRRTPSPAQRLPLRRVSTSRASTATASPASLDVERRLVTVRASAPTIDRDREIVLASAWPARLDVYRRNPVVLWSHPWASNEPTGPEVVVGRCVDIRADGQGLLAVIQFLPAGVNRYADMIFAMFQEGALQAVSVGFYSSASVNVQSPPADLAALPSFARDALSSGACRRVHTDVELFEISVVAVPSNRDSLALSVNRNGRELAAKGLAFAEQLQQEERARRLLVAAWLRARAVDARRRSAMAWRLAHGLQ